jgi:hypothetical protein
MQCIAPMWEAFSPLCETMPCSKASFSRGSAYQKSMVHASRLDLEPGNFLYEILCTYLLSNGGLFSGYNSLSVSCK